jgi:hypothetical protein
MRAFLWAFEKYDWGYLTYEIPLDRWSSMSAKATASASCAIKATATCTKSWTNPAGNK